MHAPALNSRPARLEEPQLSKVSARFWPKVDRSDPDGCWTWTASTDSKTGYGRFAFGGGRSTWLAHRVSKLIEIGELLPKSFVLHHCDNPPCVRPDHLYVGDAVMNFQDMVDRGHVRGASVTPVPKKLTADLVLEARRRVAANESRNAVAKSLGVSRQTISDVVARKLWAHVD